MTEYNSIRTVLKELLLKTKNNIYNHFGGFLFLNVILIIILISFTASYNWMALNLPLYKISISMVILRITVFCFWVGVAVGWMKILFKYISTGKIKIKKLFNYYYLLPNILSFIGLIYTVWMIPISYLMYKFPYNFTKYGTNLSLYLQEIQNKLFNLLNNEIDKNLVSAYFNETDMIIISILGIIYYAFIIKYWSAVFFIIEREINIIDAIKLCSKSSQKISHILIIGLLTLLSTSLIILFQNIILLSCVFILIMIIWIHYFKLVSKLI